MRKIIYGLGISLTLAACVQAGETMVQFGEPGGSTDIVTANVNGSAATKTYVPNTTNSPLSGVTTDSPYFQVIGVGPAGASTKLKGNIKEGSPDYIGATDKTNPSHTIMFVWEELLTGPRKLDTISFTASPRRSPSIPIRLVIQKDGADSAAWYISDVAGAVTAKTDYTFEVDTLNWFSFDPTTDITAIGSPASLDFTQTKFQTVGAWFTPTRESNWYGVYIYYFKAESLIIPNVGLYIESN